MERRAATRDGGPTVSKKPGLLLRLVRRRRESGLWVYLALVSCWAALTIVAESFLLWGWRTYVASAALFALLFEVGVSTILAFAYSSHRVLELEGEAVDEALGKGD